MSVKGVLRAGLLVAVAGALAYAAYQVREKRNQAVAKADEIESQLDALDPVTRAAVVARLSATEANRVQSRLQH